MGDRDDEVDDDPRSTGEILVEYFAMVDEYVDLIHTPERNAEELATLLRSVAAVEAELVRRTLPSPRVSD